jgi:hypothetical protein
MEALALAVAVALALAARKDSQAIDQRQRCVQYMMKFKLVIIHAQHQVLTTVYNTHTHAHTHARAHTHTHTHALHVYSRQVRILPRHHPSPVPGQVTEPRGEELVPPRVLDELVPLQRGVAVRVMLACCVMFRELS